MKRFLLLVAICFWVVVLLPVSTQAAGNCGENVLWEFDPSAGVITITGQGEMDTGDHPPWLDYLQQIRKVVITEGVTSVGNNAFLGCKELEEVILPESVQRIERNAFNGCWRLSSVDLTHITYIGDYAFNQCALEEVRVPDAITKIGYAAFSNCTSLKTLILHNKVTEIGSYAFSQCVSLTTVNLPDSVQILGPSSFSGCSKLTNLRLNEGLQIIDNSAFSHCYALEKLIVPDTVKEIRSYAFSNCKNLKEAHIGAGVSEIGSIAFGECVALSGFTLSDENSSFWIHRGVLYSKDKTKMLIMPQGFAGEYSIPDGTTTIAERACYSSGITAVTIPGSVIEIGKYAFCHCEDLEKVDLQTGVQIIEIDAFSRTPIYEITIPNSVTKIKGLAFSFCTNLQTIRFEGEPPKIDDSAFTNVRATVYRPANSAKWLDAEKLYGGYLYWESVGGCDHHPVANIMRPPTCTANGVLGPNQCSYCGLVLEGAKEIPPDGHKFSQWVEMKPATVDEEGLAQRMCSVCYLLEQKKLSKLPQTLPSEPATLPTEETKATEPPIIDEPTVPSPSESKPTDQTLPVGTEEICPTASTQTGCVEQEEPNESGDVKWGAFALAAVISIFAGFGIVTSGFRYRKKQK